MLKKVLLTAASAVAVTMGAAQAGELLAELRNVNTGAGDHTDTNAGFTSFCNAQSVLGLTICSRQPSVEKAFPGVPYAVIAIERFVGTDHPMDAHVEVNLRDDTNAPTIENPSTVTITLRGATWKQNFSIPEIVRPGSDGIFSAVATPVINGVAGGNQVRFVLTPRTENSVLVEEAVGFTLPIQMTACNDVFVDFSVVSNVPGFPAVERTASTQILACDGSVAPIVRNGGGKIDYQQDFKGFSEEDSSGAHVPVDYVTIGGLGLRAIANLFDLKASPTSQESRVDVETDVEAIEFTLMFEDLIGIKEISLGGGARRRLTDAEYRSGMVNFRLNRSMIASLLDGLIDDNLPEKGETRSDDFAIRLHAFPVGERNGPKSVDIFDAKGNLIRTELTGVGAIKHQDVAVSRLYVDFDPEKVPGTPPVKFVKFDGTRGLLIDSKVLLGNLRSTGINFGPFDWVGDVSMGTANVFRVTHVPVTDAHGNRIDPVKYQIEIKGPTNGSQYAGPFKCSAPQQDNKELVITNAELSACIRQNIGGTGNFGRGDVSFTFFVNEPKMDVDRLMLRNGIVTGYGDNSNDANSLKAQSCDDGRFGPHVDNKLLNDAQRLLVDLCSTNAQTPR
jgi:hypothetical protein